MQASAKNQGFACGIGFCKELLDRVTSKAFADQAQTPPWGL